MDTNQSQSSLCENVILTFALVEYSEFEYFTVSFYVVLFMMTVYREDTLWKIGHKINIFEKIVLIAQFGM